MSLAHTNSCKEGCLEFYPTDLTAGASLRGRMWGGSLSLSMSWHTCFSSLPRARPICVIRKGGKTLSGVAPLYASNNCDGTPHPRGDQGGKPRRRQKVSLSVQASQSITEEETHGEGPHCFCDSWYSDYDWQRFLPGYEVTRSI